MDCQLWQPYRTTRPGARVGKGSMTGDLDRRLVVNGNGRGQPTPCSGAGRFLRCQYTGDASPVTPGLGRHSGSP